MLPGETVLLDAGTTVGAMGEFLRETERLTVITAGLTALEELADADDARVECLGGTLRHLSQGFLGPLTEAALARVTFDRAFLGADAVTADRGICEAELEQTRLKELMIERAGAVYVLAHAAKLGQRPFHAWAPLPPRVTLVTDSSATDGRPFTDAGIEVVRVGGCLLSRTRPRPHNRPLSTVMVMNGPVPTPTQQSSPRASSTQRQGRRRTPGGVMTPMTPKGTCRPALAAGTVVVSPPRAPLAAWLLCVMS